MKPEANIIVTVAGLVDMKMEDSTIIITALPVEDNFFICARFSLR